MISGDHTMKWRQACATVLCAILLGQLATMPALAQDPKVPPGIDPGLEPVAILTTGLDYTEPAIAARLARDGEGELIGWDFVDNDRRPFAKSPNGTPPNWGGDGTVLVRQWLNTGEGAKQSLIPVRINLADPVSLGRALTFVAQTRAKTVAVPMWSERREDWDAFTIAAKRFAELTLIVPRCAGGPPASRQYPAALDLPNLRRVAQDAVASNGLEVMVLQSCRPVSPVGGGAK